MKGKLGYFLILSVVVVVLGWTLADVYAKPAPPPVVTMAEQAGRLQIVADPGDSLHHIDLSGFTEAPVIVCSPANEQVGVACQAVTAVDGAVWVRSGYDVPVSVTINWIAQGD